MKDDKVIEQIYNLNEDFSLYTLDSNWLSDFSTYGWHFVKWTDGSNTLSDGQTIRITNRIKSISAIWDRNEYDVTFYEDEQMKTELDEQKVKYKLSALDPITEKHLSAPTKDGYYFDKWSCELGPILSDTYILPVFESWKVLSYKWNDANVTLISSFNYKKGEIPDPYGIDWITARQFQTITGYLRNPDEDYGTGMRQSQTYLVNFISNIIETKLNPPTVEFEDGKTYQISVDIKLTPENPGKMVYTLFKVGDGEWSETKPSFTEPGQYVIHMSSSCENYLPCVTTNVFELTGLPKGTLKYDSNYP